MRIFNEEKTQELKEYDLTKGYLKDDKLFVTTHAEQSEVTEQFHYEYKEYPNGGKDQIKVIDVTYKPKVDAYDEYEDIKVYVPFTQEELNEQKVQILKQQLENTDYLAIKFAEGQLTAEEYAETKAQRQAWRDEINELEK